MPFLHPLAGARGWSRIRASAAITVFCTLASQKQKRCQQAHCYDYGLFRHFYFRSLRKFTKFFLIS